MCLFPTLSPRINAGMATLVAGRHSSYALAHHHKISASCLRQVAISPGSQFQRAAPRMIHRIAALDGESYLFKELPAVDSYPTSLPLG